MILKGHLFIEEKDFTKNLQHALTIANPLYGRTTYNGEDNGVEQFIYLWKYFAEHKYYRVPRYALGNISSLDVKIDVGVSPIVIKFAPKNTKFELNSAQNTTIDSCIKFLKKELGAVIVAQPGEGKTVMAIKIICELKQKTLILVHKDSLLAQWKSELLSLTNLREKDIGLLKQGKFIDGKVVIGSMQSLMRGTIPASVNKKFGLCLADECHRTSAKMFLRAFTRFNPMYRLALSATPYREDKMERLFFYHTSENIVNHVSVRNTGSNFIVIPYERKSKWGYYPWLPFREGLIRNVIEDVDRNKMICAVIQYHMKEGRKIIIMGERIKHLKTLMAETKKLFPKLTIVRFFGAEQLSAKRKAMGEVQEKVVDPTQAELNKADIVFATFKKASEGNNIPHLDTIIYATPFGSKTTLEQTKGRVERMMTDKNHPLVVDICDYGKGLLEALFLKRLKQYQKLGMKELALPKY